ncbi:exonuclease SbcCD subunit D [Pedococcus sp. 5OH_020]|uniref:exonuclease SbcCD subunit D n=1 Tax=Pedococcus sp. 5OH_020 TaxID=2989814 RepID=UPI0022EA0350|nr:exonuclease SbcCD subunit D [Pedococcus sp. 5OH_020]
MRFLHTSDWHLGRSFHQVGLLDAQAQLVDHLVSTVRSEQVDAVLVAGDIYDRAMPAPETVQLLSESVTRLIDAGATVLLSSGNHDSAIRLGFAHELLARAGLHIRSSVASIGTPVMVKDVAVYPLPYLEPSVACAPLASADRTHAGVLGAALARVRVDRQRRARSVVMAHAFVTGGATTDSERDISVGGVSAVHPRVFAGHDYVALGHLHGRQRVGEHLRYSGSPLALSFSEAGQTKGSWLVDLDDDGVHVQAVDSPVARPLATIRGDLDSILADPALTHAERAWCQVTLTDPARPLGAMERVRRRFPHTLELRFDPQGMAVPVRRYAERVEAHDDVDVCCQFLEHVRGGARASAQERALLARAVESVRVGAARHDDEGQLGHNRATAGAA